MVDDLQREDVISKKTKATSKLAVSSGLNMATKVHLVIVSRVIEKKCPTSAFHIPLRIVREGQIFRASPRIR